MKYGKLINEWVLGRILCFFIGLLVVFPIAGVFSKAQAISAQPGCGDTISTNVTLEANLDCSTFEDTALIVEGPARLDLNGFEVICSSDQDGIIVIEEGATILNGMVSGGRIGIRLIYDENDENNGYHRVVNMRVLNCSSRGIRAESDNNELTNNYIENSGKGIRVEGNYNRIVGNTMVNNGAENCDVRGSKNLFLNNIAKDGPEECFLIGDLEGEPTEQEANDNLFQNNIAINCGAGGFVTASGTWGNYLIRNTAYDNSPIDFIDYNRNCKDNDWIMNTAGSGRPRCTTLPGFLRYSFFGNWK
jgi:parallel beta-helix repeat protein